MFKKANWGIVLMALCLFAACTKPDNGNNNEGGGNNDTIIGGDNNDTITNGGDTLVNIHVIVATLTPINITDTEATCGAKITVNESGNLKELGICWSMATDPTVNDSVCKTENCTETFVYTLTGLVPETEYHVRAYTLNGTEYIYGLDESFTTLKEQNSFPVGAINSLFTINEDGDQVYFSQGNLQYQASTNTFQFAKTQLEYIGWRNSRISPSYDGWIDLFGWGTSGWDCGHPYYHPWDYEPGNYGPVGNDLTGEYANSDWGVYNPIYHGSDQPGLWRTLTQPEWETLLMTRQTPSGIRYVKAKIDATPGLLIIPDNWDSDTYSFTNPNLYESYFTDNLITEDDWHDILEPAGVVFLPAAGVRSEKTVCETTKTGNYWSATHHYSYGFALLFHDYYIYTNDYYNHYHGKSVRLVQDAKKQNN